MRSILTLGPCPALQGLFCLLFMRQTRALSMMSLRSGLKTMEQDWNHDLNQNWKLNRDSNSNWGQRWDGRGLILTGLILGTKTKENGLFGPVGVSLVTRKRYSTATAPPPPPPPPPPPSHDKNAKGKKILNRITRAFTFSFSSLLVFFAAGVSLLVVYLILSELFLPSGDTRTFNKAVKLVQQNEEARKALNFDKHERLKAYGNVQADKWARNRPPQTIRTKGKDGKDHLLMKFHVESKSGGHGSVTLEQVDESFWSSEFAYIALDIPGSKRIYIKEPKFKPKRLTPRMGGIGEKGSFLGLKWGPKKDD